MMRRGTVSYERINALLEQESDVQEAQNPLSSITNGRLDYDIKSFQYENEPTLSQIHLDSKRDKLWGWSVRQDLEKQLC